MATKAIPIVGAIVAPVETALVATRPPIAFRLFVVMMHALPLPVTMGFGMPTRVMSTVVVAAMHVPPALPAVMSKIAPQGFVVMSNAPRRPVMMASSMEQKST
jgi:hypothetical protein